ncbi:hypothetical protein Cflav_PD6199 [Pedosphaera parvula Ellin514]|uniref:Uncharacterized protein n=1 Tax=Pedosphaera parvula (strain Ellin514) TaxID=320771 RepID=B9XHN1_PEDPL|nr:hypothetical protein Cflav_PD6199 [Pedosphaera parvula Ellin514]
MSKQKPSNRLAEDKRPHWWKTSPFFGPGADFWYDKFWKPRVLSAWAYELVRRLEDFPRLEIPELSPEDREMLRGMPPYPRLSHQTQIGTTKSHS